MSILGKISGLAWDREKQRNDDLIDRKFMPEEMENNAAFTRAQLLYCAEQNRISNEKNSLKAQETKLQKDFKMYLEPEENVPDWALQQQYISAQQASSQYNSALLSAQGLSSSSISNVFQSTGTAATVPQYPIYMGSGGNTFLSGSAIASQSVPRYSTIGLGASDKNVFFSLLRGIEERAQFEKEYTHPYDDDALSIQDMRKFTGKISLLGLLSFCLANSIENIDVIVSILVGCGMRVE